MGILSYIEAFIGRLLYNFKGLDAKLFIKSPSCQGFPNITVKSTETGETTGWMDVEESAWGEERFPSLTWSVDDATAQQKTVEYVMIVQDADVPIWIPITHGLYYGITQTSLQNSDFKPIASSTKGQLQNFKHGKNVRGTIYSAPKPILMHGTHRYFFQVIAVDTPLNLPPYISSGDVHNAIEGKVVAVGYWLGKYENTGQHS